MLWPVGYFKKGRTVTKHSKGGHVGGGGDTSFVESATQVYDHDPRTWIVYIRSFSIPLHFGRLQHFPLTATFQQAYKALPWRECCGFFWSKTAARTFPLSPASGENLGPLPSPRLPLPYPSFSSHEICLSRTAS